jgi:hypothetical protein
VPLDLPPDARVTIERGGDLIETATAAFSQDHVYRYALTRLWDPRPAAVFVMLNPSTADAFRTDPTVTRCARFARRENCGGLVIVNLFALRSTDPRELRRHPDPVGPGNDDHILEHCRPGRLVIAAWGTHGRLRDRDRAVLAMLSAAQVTLHCFGTTTGGSPRHPLYLPGNAQLTAMADREAGALPTSQPQTESRSPLR